MYKLGFILLFIGHVAWSQEHNFYFGYVAGIGGSALHVNGPTNPLILSERFSPHLNNSFGVSCYLNPKKKISFGGGFEFDQIGANSTGEYYYTDHFGNAGRYNFKTQYSITYATLPLYLMYKISLRPAFCFYIVGGGFVSYATGQLGSTLSGYSEFSGTASPSSGFIRSFKNTNNGLLAGLRASWDVNADIHLFFEARVLQGTKNISAGDYHSVFISTGQFRFGVCNRIYKKEDKEESE